jgi:hypothetical protein
MKSLPFLLPWLRLELFIRAITTTTWDDQAWPSSRPTWPARSGCGRR